MEQFNKRVVDNTRLFLPQFWLVTKCIWVDPCEVISSKIGTNQRRG